MPEVYPWRLPLSYTYSTLQAAKEFYNLSVKLRIALLIGRYGSLCQSVNVVEDFLWDSAEDLCYFKISKSSKLYSIPPGKPPGRLFSPTAGITFNPHTHIPFTLAVSRPY
ncbi:MAG: hypothetical protein ACE5I0_10315 [Candidatus Binatia bacterium]